MVQFVNDDLFHTSKRNIQADKFFNADEDPDPYPITAEERLNEAWQQKMEAKG